MSSRHAAIILGVLGILVLVLGYLHEHGATTKDVISDLYANFGTDFVGIAITVLVIDQLNQRRQEEDLKRQLIRDMGSGSNVFAIRAIHELKAHGKTMGGWLKDGSLHNAILLGANLSEAPLEGASLYGIELTGAKLSGAFLADAKLNKAILRFADLSGANLEAADLREADLSGAVLRGANLQGANLQGADLSEAVLVGLKYDSATQWPEGFGPSSLNE